MNQLLLNAGIAEASALRYTPAGLPALDMSLKHESEVSENGQPRKVSLEIKALAIGEITAKLSAAALGSSGQFGGFLAAIRNGRGIRFHITAVDLDV